MGALTCGVRSYLNLSQLLPTLETKAKYYPENAVGTSCTRSIFGFVAGFVAVDTASTRSTSSTRSISSIRSISRFYTTSDTTLRIFSGSH